MTVEVGPVSPSRILPKPDVVIEAIVNLNRGNWLIRSTILLPPGGTWNLVRSRLIVTP